MIALIENGKVGFIGVERKNDTMKFIENDKNAFEIGSITKVFTATLLSNFVNEQKLKLDDNIQDYLDFKIMSENKITFKQLANHTSGLPRLPSNLNLFFVDQDNPYKDYDNEKLIDYLSKETQLNHEPGMKYEYSNLGAGMLGFVLAVISKSSYESLLEEKIFTAYKLKNSTSIRENVETKLVKGIKPNGETASNWDFDVLAGGGEIFSTVEDLSKFALAQFDKTNNELTLTQKPTFKINNNMSIGLGFNHGERETGLGLIYSIGIQKTVGEKQRLRLNPNLMIGGFIPIAITGTRDQFYRMTTIGYNLHYDLLKFKSVSVVTTIGPFASYSRGLLGTGGDEDIRYDNSELFHSFYYGGNGSIGLRIDSPKRKIAYEIRPVSGMVGNESFYLTYVMFGMDFKFKK